MQSDINEKLLNFLRKNPEGVTQDKLTSTIPFKEDEIVDCLNTLITENRITILDSPEGALFKYRSEKDALKFRDLTKEDVAVYEIVMQSGSNGISTNDIKVKIRIDNTTYINKILLKLSKKFLIKSLKVLNTKNKKVWIGYEIEPSQEITGGIWCSNQEFDNNLVSVFSDKCYERIASQSTTSRRELLLYARTTNLTKNNLDIKEDDIQKILNILVFDGKIEPIFPENININYLDNKYAILLIKNEPSLDMIKYRKIKDYKAKSIFDSVCCGVCPIVGECRKSNVVNPNDCPHLNGFLEFNKNK